MNVQLNWSRDQLSSCGCCGRKGVETPYSHTQHDPPHNSWSYCEACRDADCEGPFAGGCELDLGTCVVCKRDNQLLVMQNWCDRCFEGYEKYLETHPIPPGPSQAGPFGQMQTSKHLPAYMLNPSEWPSIDFDPTYITNPASAPPPTKRKAHIVSQQSQSESPEDMMRRLIREEMGGGSPAPASTNAEMPTIDAFLASIDPRDSDTHIKLYNHLRDNARLHKIGTLDQGGYILLYQEPEGSSKQGWTAGGTQGDRIVDDALEKAQANGHKALKGLCRKCFSPVTMVDGQPPEAESPRAGTDAKECPSGGHHEFAS